MSRFYSFPNATLGHTIRAFRLGYRWSRHGYFLRMSREGQQRVRIDIAPADNVPKHNTATKNHICWWEDSDDNGWGMIDQITPLKGVVAVHQPISFCITEEGEYAGL